LAGGKKIRKVLLRLVGVVIAVALLALLAASLIIAKPQEEEQPSAPVRPSAQANPAITAESEQELTALIAGFPAPVMSFMSGSGMTFVSAVSSDSAVSGGFARNATLYWQTEDAQPLILQSICPADALSLLEDGYHFSAVAGPTLFGNRSVRMEKGDTIRIHTTTDQALYVLILPRSLDAQVSALCRSLQLFTVNPEAVGNPS
jgi:hypothetical protein